MFDLLRRAVVAIEKIAERTASIDDEIKSMRAEQKKFMEISQNTDPTDKILGFMGKLGIGFDKR